MLSLQNLYQWFIQFNHDYFSNELPCPQLFISHSRTRLGSMNCKVLQTPNGVYRSNYSIRISDFYEQTDKEYQTTLLHEMIHYYIAYNKLQDSSAHGVIFQRMMSELNFKYGWNINISATQQNIKARERLLDNKPRLILSIVLSDRGRFISVVNIGYIHIIEDKIKTIPTLVSYKWYVSSNPYFANFPSVRSLRGRNISEEEWKKLEDKMQPINPVL